MVNSTAKRPLIATDGWVKVIAKSKNPATLLFKNNKEL